MIVIAGTTRGRAADWSHAVSASLGAAAVSNPGLSPGADAWDRSAFMELSETTLARTERLTFSLTPQLLATRFEQNRSLNSDSGSALAGLAWSFERGRWNLDAQGTADTTLTSELGLTGITTANRRHEAFSVTNGFSHSSSERLSWNGTVGWSTTRYVDARDLGLTNYRNVSLQLGPAWSLTPTLSGTLTVSANLLNSAKASPETSYSASAGLGSSVSERISWQTSVGATRLQSQGRPSTSEVYSLSVSLQGDPLSWSANASRAVTPIGFGSFSLSDQLRLAANAGVSEYSSLAASLSLVRSSPVGSQQISTYSGATWVQFGADWQWKFARQWSASAAVSRAWSRAARNGPWANSSQVHLNLLWGSDRL
jgi:hypothetical protein